MIPTESTLFLEDTNMNFIKPKITKLIKNTTNPFDKIDKIYKAGKEDYFCTMFPPPDCFEIGKSDDFKTNVEFFREQFCPRQVSSPVTYNTVAYIFIITRE